MNLTTLKFFWMIGCCMVFSTGYSQGFNAEVTAAEEQRFKAMVSKDTVALAGLLSPELLYVHSNGTKESKADFIRSVGSGKIVYGEISREEPPLISKWGKKAVSINGQVQVKGVVNGNQFDIHLKYLSLYVKRKGKWELVRWQSAKI